MLMTWEKIKSLQLHTLLLKEEWKLFHNPVIQLHHPEAKPIKYTTGEKQQLAVKKGPNGITCIHGITNITCKARIQLQTRLELCGAPKEAGFR